MYVYPSGDANLNKQIMEKLPGNPINESPPSDINFNLYVTLPGKPMTVSPSINANLN